MGDHSKKIEAGRSVYNDMCSETYLIPDGEPSINSVDDLKQIKTVFYDNLPWLNDGNEYIDLTAIEHGAVAAKGIEIFYVCPRPNEHGHTNKEGNWCGSADKDSFQFGEVWQCTDCGTFDDTEDGAESCCRYNRERSLTPKTPANFMLNAIPVDHVSGMMTKEELLGMMTKEELLQEAAKRGAKVIIEHDPETGTVSEVTIPRGSKAEWGLD